MLPVKEERELSGESPSDEAWRQASDAVGTRLRQGEGSDVLPRRWRVARLSKRTLIAVEGLDALGLANDLTTNDLAREDRKAVAQTTAFLTAQGTLQQISLAVRTPQGLLLECDRTRLDAFAETLWKARLGRAVSFRWLKDMQVLALFPEDRSAQNEEQNKEQNKEQDEVQDEVLTLVDKQTGGRQTQAQQDTGQGKARDVAGYLFADPRKPLAAMRLWHRQAEQILSPLSLLWAEEEHFEGYRLARGVVERAEEWEGTAREGTSYRHGSHKYALPFVFGLDELGAMDWRKDCYVGQEIAARLKYRARDPKRHALPVRLLAGKEAGKGVVRGGDKVLVETHKHAGKEPKGTERTETSCGEVLYRVADEQQTILFVLFTLALLRGKKPLLAGRQLTILGASGERWQGELLLPRWLAGLAQRQES